MARLVLLDTGSLGKLAHPKAHPELAAWFARLMAGDITVVVPEIADYELRRNFLLKGLDVSIRRLDQLEQQAGFLPITTAHMRKAAELWALARKSGQPTADEKALDGDVILAAQALSVGGVVATENVGHLRCFC